ncbi:hypothetical protein [Streptacidiphilus albus]|uniref:hypothetical protein n=1 Tax=Streptacidiphilus albus TaxID=105425 RepID=UPI0005A7A496|nr:hypothetical protein [Streptacidiphilus albus]
MRSDAAVPPAPAATAAGRSPRRRAVTEATGHTRARARAGAGARTGTGTGADCGGRRLHAAGLPRPARHVMNGARTPAFRQARAAPMAGPGGTTGRPGAGADPAGAADTANPAGAADTAAPAGPAALPSADPVGPGEFLVQLSAGGPDPVRRHRGSDVR